MEQLYNLAILAAFLRVADLQIFHGYHLPRRWANLLLVVNEERSQPLVGRAGREGVARSVPDLDVVFPLGLDLELGILAKIVELNERDSRRVLMEGLKDFEDAFLDLLGCPCGLLGVEELVDSQAEAIAEQNHHLGRHLNPLLLEFLRGLE